MMQFGFLVVSVVVSVSGQLSSTSGELDAFIPCPGDAECLECVRNPGCTYFKALPRFSQRPSLCFSVDKPMPFQYLFTEEFKDRDQCLSGLGETPTILSENPDVSVIPLTLDETQDSEVLEQVVPVHMNTTTWTAILHGLADGKFMTAAIILVAGISEFNIPGRIEGLLVSKSNNDSHLRQYISSLHLLGVYVDGNNTEVGQKILTEKNCFYVPPPRLQTFATTMVPRSLGIHQS